jgi:lipoprotein NlpI
MRSFLPVVLGSLFVAVLLAEDLRADKAEELVADAQMLAARGQIKEALTTVSKAIALDPKNYNAYALRGSLYDAQRKLEEALADYSKVIALDPEAADAYSRRGGVHFKMGHIKESIADFDKQIQLKPSDKAGHWRRGISYYYAGRYDDGRKQFEGYEAVDTNDVENAVWHFLCLARSQGVAKARKALLKIGKDSRVPMAEVYALFAGKAKPADVLAAAKKGAGDKAALRRPQLFYAHLYLGLYYEVTGDQKAAREHMTKAAEDYRIGHYMGDVARVHLALLKKAGERKPGK